ncbi:PepSY-associated TM helix domain-containing protein [Phenylobacterium aquaticum]|uniref:PepSY-associated TM helix domain-containing protein n=1 Tax=Phenylobacterium aquaticum TaxID=1763816 RepID=UPI001F5D35FD|nr:PepSY domain-containing protein [Phenylobacterium aquaticum]MCI3131835.1 PepSY domain-containing protein [Phenylobacterium aquaticum]
MTDREQATRRILLHRLIWRWHFYAGLFCVPFVLILAITGAIYLFKPQVEAALDAPYAHLRLTGPVASPEAQALAAAGSLPGGRLKAYQLPQTPDQATQVIVRAGGQDVRVYLNPQTLEVLKTVPEKARFMAIAHDIHGELLMGRNGSILVELAGSWALVMVLTGLYLWWPREAQGLAGVLYPRLGGRLFWRDLHAVTGVWISGLALFLLLTALPWTQVWGQGFKALRTAAVPHALPADWPTAGAAAPDDPHADHEGMGGMAGMAGMKGMSGHDHIMRGDYAALNLIVPQAAQMNLAYPALVSPPGKHGRKASANWTVKSDAQNRPLRQEIAFDAQGWRLSRQTFADKPLVDRVVAVGVAAHEGQLFGLPNQLLGLVAALGMITLSVSGLVMWWTRRPEGRLGAPAILDDRRLSWGLGLLILAFAVFLPVLGASLVAVALVEQLILRWTPGVRTWLGLRPRSRAAS